MLQESSRKKALYYLFAVILITLFIYSFSLFRPWQPFDERLFYSEEFLPIPSSFSEIFEVINSFVINYHIVSMNSFFSNWVTLRSNQLASILIVFVSFFLKKHAFSYHLLQLFIHIVNSAMVFLILKKLLALASNKKILSETRLALVSILTLVWSLHSTNTEAVLLVTNWTTLLTYTFCFCFLLYEVSKIKEFKTSLLNKLITSVLFCTLMFFTEYAYSLPIIIFFLLSSTKLNLSSSIKEAITFSFNKSTPYFLGIFLYIMFSLLIPNSTLINLINNNTTSFSIYPFLERNLWLTPQIFIHFFKLLFFPATLSTYQSNLIHPSNSLFNLYSIFCCISYLLFLILPAIFFIKSKNHKFLFPLIYCFYFSLFPFLHILAPTYCLIADRYCYFPLFFLLLFILQVTFVFYKKEDNKFPVYLLLLILIALATRTYIRILDWNNPKIFFQSAIKADNNPLYKAQKLTIYAGLADKDQSLNRSLEILNTNLDTLEEETKNYNKEPLTLKLYGLDSKSLLLKAIYLIASIKSDYLNENPKTTLVFYESYIKKELKIANINELLFYASILSKNGQFNKAVKILKYSYKRFPYSPEVLKSLANYYFYKKDFQNLDNILNQAYKLFPNDREILGLLYNYYSIINNKEKMSRFEYLIRLREHLNTTN